MEGEAQAFSGLEKRNARWRRTTGPMLRAPAPGLVRRAPAADWQPGSGPHHGARSAALLRCAPRDRGTAPAEADQRHQADAPRRCGSSRCGRREWRPWLCWRTTPPFRPGAVSAAHGARSDSLSARARYRRWGRPGDVIASSCRPALFSQRTSCRSVALDPSSICWVAAEVVVSTEGGTSASRSCASRPRA